MSFAAAQARPRRGGADRGRAPLAQGRAPMHDMTPPTSPTSIELARWTATTTGVVFCGGKSSRMGADKALLELADGRSLLERACATLEPVAGEVWLACGPRARYGELGRQLVLDRRPDGGPLAGLEAVLERATTRWVAALACDMPRVAPADVAELLARAEADDLDACWLETPKGPEPLCAVYSRTCLEPIRAALDAGQRRMIAFHTYPVGGRALRLSGSDPRRPGLAQNLNTPADWDDYRKATR